MQSAVEGRTEGRKESRGWRMDVKWWCMSEKALHNTNDAGPDVGVLSVTIQLSLGTERF